MAVMTEKVTHVHHWNDNLFSFRTTRDPGYRFKNGHFTMIGLPNDERPLMRAYSITSYQLLESYKGFNEEDYSSGFSICYQAAANNNGLNLKY